MTNTQKVKGDRFELAVQHWLHEHGFPWVQKTRAGYERDTGDLHLEPGPLVIAQCKNHARWCLPEWIGQLRAQLANARAQHGALVLKRRGVNDPGQAWVVLTLEQWTALLREAGHGAPVEQLSEVG